MTVDAAIMVVEDDDATREFLADNLTADSFGVVTASTGREAFNLLQMKECDLLLLDVMLVHTASASSATRMVERPWLPSHFDHAERDEHPVLGAD